jgi:hypothetical protein
MPTAALVLEGMTVAAQDAGWITAVALETD